MLYLYRAIFKWIFLLTQIISYSKQGISNESLVSFDCAKWENIGCKCIDQIEIWCILDSTFFYFFFHLNGESLSIYCGVYRSAELESFKYVNLPTMNLSYIRSANIDLCPLKPFGSSYSIFKHFGIQQIASLTYNTRLYSFPQKIMSQHFSELTNLQILKLELKYVDELSNDLFLRQIKYIYLLVYSKVTLSYNLTARIEPLDVAHSRSTNATKQSYQSLAKLTSLVLDVYDENTILQSHPFYVISNWLNYDLHKTELSFRRISGGKINDNIVHNINWTWNGRRANISLGNQLFANLRI